jgi:hypothetical protein
MGQGNPAAGQKLTGSPARPGGDEATQVGDVERQPGAPEVWRAGCSLESIASFR